MSTISSWMTIHYISRVYDVPEGYLDQRLGITNPQSADRVSLSSLAARYHRSLEGLISQIQIAIKTYRREHPANSSACRHANELLALERSKT